MPVDARGLSAHVLVDGRAVPELSDPDTTPRDWAFLRTAATNGQVSPEAAAACAQKYMRPGALDFNGGELDVSLRLTPHSVLSQSCDLRRCHVRT